MLLPENYAMRVKQHDNPLLPGRMTQVASIGDTMLANSLSHDVSEQYTLLQLPTIDYGGTQLMLNILFTTS